MTVAIINKKQTTTQNVKMSGLSSLKRLLDKIIIFKHSEYENMLKYNNI